MQLLSDRRLVLSFSIILGLLLLASLVLPGAYALTIRLPKTTTIHVEDQELCRAYPVFAKELAVKKLSGRPLSYDAYAGRQITVEALLSAHCYGTVDGNGNYSFLAVIEIRDSNGVTQQLSLQQATIKPWTEMPVGVSWIPDMPGEYEIRAFSMPDLNGRIILTEIVTIRVAVIE